MHTNLVHNEEILEFFFTKYVHKLDQQELQLQTYKLHTIIQIYTCTYIQNINTHKHTT